MLNILKAILISSSLGALLWGCDTTPELDVRTFNLQNRSGFEAAELINPYVYSDREGAPGAMSALPDAITVRETPDNLSKIERVLAEFDKAIPSVQLTFQLIEADSFTDEDPDIAEVVQELRALFRFQGYRLLGEAMVTLGGSQMASQEFSTRFLGPEETFSLEGETRMDRPGAVRLQGLRLWFETNDAVLESSVTVSRGQTVVIGGARARAGGRTLILTVRAD